MLIKEYRIPLPLTVEEYRIAQLYMIAKKSREESKGVGSGVEILINEPYTDGPGGHGQYTKKLYHVGSHLPGWFKSLLPKSALTVEEEAWNAYPYTKTRYTCPFVEKFSLEIETYYFADNGYQKNVFGLSDSELRNRAVAETDPHEGKRKTEALWPIFKIHHQKSRYIYDLFYRRKAISRDLYEFCLKENIADKNLIAKWKKQGYENLCCLRCIQTRDTNFGTNCICRVPKIKLEEGRIVECVHCGCRGCSG